MLRTGVLLVRALGIDPSTKTGVVVLDGQNVAYAGLLELNTVDGFQRSLLLKAALKRTIEEFKPDVAAIEGYAFGNKFSLATMVEIGTLFRERLYEDGVPWTVIAPTQLKKFVLGKGPGSKSEVRLGAYKLWGFEHASDDVVDAYVLAKMATLYQSPGSCTQIQREVLGAIKKPSVCK